MYLNKLVNYYYFLVITTRIINQDDDSIKNLKSNNSFTRKSIEYVST